MKKVLLYFASNSAFYTNLFISIKNGFEEAGCLVVGEANLLCSGALIRQIEIEKPDFVFEMNRVKSEIPNFPNDVIHICWLVDFWGREYSDLKGSDILYAWTYSWIENFKKNGVASVKYLPSATDSKIYKPINIKKIYDFTFLGHISKRWTSYELNREVGIKDDNKIYFKDILPIVENLVLSQEYIESTIEELTKRNYNLKLNKSLIYDLSSRIYRQKTRELYMDKFLGITNNISIYGPNNWALYEKYKNNYKGFLEKPEQINKAMQKANILLHFTFIPHFRVLDAMACGMVSTAFETPNIYKNEFEILGFKSNEDYLEIDTKCDRISQEFFNNKQLLADISYNARKKTLKNHLWVHRAEQVLKDVERISHK
ncbi:MAG: glycosyltransferase [Sulfurospirillaceae bacterium]|nr:glycosyltransferase [Sulfurospirillaceae bacterium]